ncbi:hypothetical protein BpHYR1_029504 [Brachionus plicatilis]|uniref:Uncharacterized protein n=1 Tax=Brachionus plicatilis TaxID=10195 RepID=A0A3M7RP86_BRAPC|nr:hypothetical protein BpHYR1_029504 [Brachionus plicatilis]
MLLSFSIVHPRHVWNRLRRLRHFKFIYKQKLMFLFNRLETLILVTLSAIPHGMEFFVILVALVKLEQLISGAERVVLTVYIFKN